MSDTLVSVGVVLAFILVGAVFVAAEIALVSLRDSQATALASRGRRGRIVAELNQDPNRFLAGAQVGVTLAGFLSAALGGDLLAFRLEPLLRRAGLPEGLVDPAALVLVTLAISYVSLVIGELVPKRLALQRTEAFALALGPTIDRVSRISRPVIWLLSRSTDVVVRLLGGDPHAQREQITDEELRELVGSHETLGEEERRILEDVFEAGDRQLREVLVPRTDVDFLDASMPVYKAAQEALSRPHSRYPVIRGSSDDVLGFVHVRDLLDPQLANRSVRVGELARKGLTLPWTRPILAALTDMRREGIHLAMVADEYGGTAGIVTMEDLVEELIGDIRDEYDVVEEPRVGVRGDLEVDGLITLDEFGERTGFVLPDGPYDTVAGYFMAQLGQLPSVGDSIQSAVLPVDADDADPTPLELKVTELDGRRAARLVVHRVDGGELLPHAG